MPVACYIQNLLTQSMQMRTSSYFSSYGNSTLANKMCASGIEVEGEGGGGGDGIEQVRQRCRQMMSKADRERTKNMYEGINYMAAKKYICKQIKHHKINGFMNFKCKINGFCRLWFVLFVWHIGLVCSCCGIL